MTVHLAPHLYETVWFWPGVVVLAIAGFTLVAVWRFRDLQQRHALEQQAALARQRDRIARDMHDDLGAGLTRLVLTGGRVATTTEQAETRTAIQRLSGEAAGLLDQLGDLVWCTNHQFDTLDSLLARLREHAATFLDEAGLTVRFDLPQTVPALPITADFRRQTLLLFKEILTNIARHAQASEVRVCLRLDESNRGESPPKDSRFEPLNLVGTRSTASPLFQPEIRDAGGTRPYQRERKITGKAFTLKLEIADNGRGFDPEAAQQAHGNGLTNLRTRATALGGSFALQSSEGHGTTIRVELPLHPHVTPDGSQDANRT